MLIRCFPVFLMACLAGACSPERPDTVRAVVQMEIGGESKEVEMPVHPVPVDPESVPADEADLDEQEIVLGIVQGGQPMAYPIRYLALSEVLNDRVGRVALAPTW